MCRIKLTSLLLVSTLSDTNAEDLRAYNRNRQREYRETQKKKSEEKKKKSEEKKKKSEMNKQYYAVCKKKQEATVLWDKTNDPATPKPVDTPKHEPSSLLPLSQSSFDPPGYKYIGIGNRKSEDDGFIFMDTSGGRK